MRLREEGFNEPRNFAVLSWLVPSLYLTLSLSLYHTRAFAPAKGARAFNVPILKRMRLKKGDA